MNWHYVEGSEARGPVTDARLDYLAQVGTVGPDTLVWREGMAEWLPYSQVKGPSGATPATSVPPVAAAQSGQVFCAECGQPFPPEEVIRHGDQFICAACKPVFLQKLKEGVAPVAVPRYAGFWIRVLAYIIDTILLDIVIVPLGFVIRAIVGASLNPLEPSMAASLMGLPINLAVVGFYYIYLVGKERSHPRKNGTQTPHRAGGWLAHRLWQGLRTILLPHSQLPLLLHRRPYGGMGPRKARPSRPHVQHPRHSSLI